MKGGSQGRNFTAEFKARVVQRLLAGESVSGLSREVQIKRQILYRWREAYRKDGLEGLARARGRPPGPSRRHRPASPPPAGEERIRELERKVGQQALVIDFLQRACKRVKESRPASKGSGATASMERSKP
jgi:transposase-like protein